MQTLRSYHTFALEAHCAEIIPIDTENQLVDLLPRLADSPFIFLGEGSNTVFVEDFDGIVLLNRLKGLSVVEDDLFFHVHVASGENWHDFVSYCLHNRMHGMENLALIPGTVGAAPIQNIGAYGVEVNNFIHSVEFIDSETGFTGYLNNKECQFGYRDSIFKHATDGKYLITAVNFCIPKIHNCVISYEPLNALQNPDPALIFETVISARSRKLPNPAEVGNAGSFFKNPEISMAHFVRLQQTYPQIPSFFVSESLVKIPAAWLIDTLGFKQKSIGGIACHQNQPLVLINKTNGSGDELITFAKWIKQQVYETFGIQLEHEVQLIGRRGRIRI